MGRSIIADEKLLPKLKEVSRYDFYNVGLILGQCSNSRDYVIHLAETPLPEGHKNKGSPSVTDGQPSGDNKVPNHFYVETLDGLKESWFSTHCKNVTRMLPGGMWVLGLYVVGPGDLFSDKTALNKISSILPFIYRGSKSNPHMRGNTPNDQLVVFNFCSLSKKYSCKSFNVGNLNMSMVSADWKFQQFAPKWFQIDTRYNLNHFLPYICTEENEKFPLKKKLKEILQTLTAEIEDATCTFEGEFRDDAFTLEELKSEKEQRIKNRKTEVDEIDDDEDSFKVHLYHQLEVRKPNEKTKMKMTNGVGDFKCSGLLFSRVFLHRKCAIDEAVKAVKDDIIRSLAARLEMHWDSYVESENNKVQKEILHLLPRRVLCVLPDTNITFSEYIFPDEGILEAANSVEEILGFSVVPNNIVEFEKQYDSNRSVGNSSSSTSKSPVCQVQKSSNYLIIGIVSAAIVLLISISIQFFGS